jgi:hypothetical protein
MGHARWWWVWFLKAWATPPARQGDALDDAGEGIAGVNLVLEIDEGLVGDADEGLEDFAEGKDAFADGSPALFARPVGYCLPKR